MIDYYLKQIKQDVIELFKKDSSGHDINHLERTMNLALHISEKEGGNKMVIALASYLHDIHRIMQNQKGHFVSPKESLPIVRKILSKTDLNNEIIEQICFCIEHHENYNWNGNNVTNLEALIVQDADNLDILGAIGIARCFTYGGANGIKLYDENIPINHNNDYAEEVYKEPSTIHHFYHKLFKLDNNMNTNTAKLIAKERIDYMKNYVLKFINEWDGKE